MASGFVAGVGAGLLNSINNNITAERAHAQQQQDMADKEQLQTFQQAAKEYDEEKRTVGAQSNKVAQDAELISGSDADPYALALAYQFNNSTGFNQNLQGDGLARMQQVWQSMKDNPDTLNTRAAQQPLQSPAIPAAVDPQRMQQFGVGQDRIDQVYGQPPQAQPPNNIIPPTQQQTNAIRDKVSQALPAGAAPPLPAPPGADPNAAQAQQPLQGQQGPGSNQAMSVDMSGPVNASQLNAQIPYNPQQATGQPSAPQAQGASSPTPAPMPSPVGGPAPAAPVNGQPPQPQPLPGTATPLATHASEPPPENYHYPTKSTDRWVSGVNEGYLESLDPEVAQKARLMISGKALPSAYQLRSTKDGPSIWGKAQDAAVHAAPNYSTSRALQVKDTMRDFDPAGGTGKSITAMNTALVHLGNLSDAADALHNTDAPALNRIANQYNVQTGGSSVNVFNAIQKRVASELASAYKANPTLTEVQSAEGDVNAWDGNRSLKDVPRALTQLLTGRIQSNESKWQDMMGKDNDTPRVRMSKEAKIVYDKLSANNDNFLGNANGLDVFQSRIDGKKFALPTGTVNMQGQ